MNSRLDQRSSLPLQLNNLGEPAKKRPKSFHGVLQVNHQQRCEKLFMSELNLDPKIVKRYATKNITRLFPWQSEFLSDVRICEEGRNLVYSAPASAGKTLVAEILMFKRVIATRKKAFMILPFVSLAREKLANLKELVQDMSFERSIVVGGFISSDNQQGGIAALDIAVCTFEKANAEINKLLVEGKLSEIGTIVVDELHLLGANDRGLYLELLLTKIKFAMLQKSHDDLHIQIIGMSATLPNLKQMALWLNAEYKVTEYRPVPLKESRVIGKTIISKNVTESRPLVKHFLNIPITEEFDRTAYLTIETILKGHSVLIFGPTKVKCEKQAQVLARIIHNMGWSDLNLTQDASEIRNKLREQFSEQAIDQLKRQLKECQGGPLVECVAFGVAYHHAGLLDSERELVEKSFKENVIRVIVATTTLSAGVNLPARRVIILTPEFLGKPLDALTYHQMSGRAGRFGYDNKGESFLMCNGENDKIGQIVFNSKLLPVKSTATLKTYQSVDSSLAIILFEGIASGLTKSLHDIFAFYGSTFFASSSSVASEETKTMIKKCLKTLEEMNVINMTVMNVYTATKLGFASLGSCLSPVQGIFINKQLIRARHNLALDEELHIIYILTPICVIPDWKLNWFYYNKLFQTLTKSQLHVASLVGVNEGYLEKSSLDLIDQSNANEKRDIHIRFHMALALSDLINETRISDVSKKYQIDTGTVQKLQHCSLSFAMLTVAFCGRIGWSDLEWMASKFVKRIESCVRPELIPLVALKCLNAISARVLYNAGITTILDLSNAEPNRIRNLLCKNEQDFETILVGKKYEKVSYIGNIIVGEAKEFIRLCN